MKLGRKERELAARLAAARKRHGKLEAIPALASSLSRFQMPVGGMSRQWDMASKESPTGGKVFSR